MSNIIRWISDAPRNFFSLLPFFLPTKSHSPPPPTHTSLFSLQNPSLGLAPWTPCHLCQPFTPANPFPAPACTRLAQWLFHLLCKKSNVTLWCLLALKSLGHGVWGNLPAPWHSSSPLIVGTQAFLVAIAHFYPHILSVVGLLIILLTKIATTLTRDLLWVRCSSKHIWIS